MALNDSRTLARNAAVLLLGQALPLLLGIVAIPPVMAGLGAERFGLLGLGWATLGYFGLLDLGLARAATRFTAEALARGARQELRAIVWSAIAVQGAIGVVAALALGGAAPAIASALTLPADLEAEAVATFRVLAIAVPVVLIAATFRGVLEAAQRFGQTAAVSAPGSALNFLIPLLGVTRGWSLVTILWWLVAARTATLIGYAVLAARTAPEVLGARFDRGTFSRLIRFGAWATVSNIIGPVLDQLDRFLLGVFAGVGAVGWYTAPQEIVLRLRMVPTAVATAVLPQFSSLAVSGDPAAIRRQYSHAIRFLFLTVGPICLLLVFLGPALLRQWLGDQYVEPSGEALQLLAVGLLANAIAYVPFAFLSGVNRPDLPARFHLLELPLFLGLAWVLMPRWGVPGAALAWSIRAVIDAGLLLWAADRVGARERGP